jgi:hypothetical protein
MLRSHLIHFGDIAWVSVGVAQVIPGTVFRLMMNAKSFGTILHAVFSLHMSIVLH